MSPFLCSTDSQDAAEFGQLDEAKLLQHVESVFLFALVWGPGGTGATNEGRRAFDVFLRTAVTSDLPNYTGPSGEK